MTPPRSTNAQRRSVLTVFAVVALVFGSAVVGVALSTQPVPDEQVFEDETDDEGLQGCERGNWPVHVIGMPRELSTTPRDGVYIWLDFEGWHLRNTSGRAVQGNVYAIGAQAIRSTDAASSAPGGAVVPTALQFDLDGNDADETVDFTVTCDFFAITFDLRGGDEPIDASSIFLGPRGSPGTNPFTIEREQTQ